MAYKRQNFENKKTVLTAEMLQLMETGIMDNDIGSRLTDNDSLEDGVYNVIFVKRNGRNGDLPRWVYTI